MRFYTFALLILKFLPIFLSEEAKPNHDELKKKLNVVIFFSHIDEKCTSLQKDTLGFLNLHEATRVKHNSAESDSSLESVPEIPNHNSKGSAYCKELLKNSLMALTHYCHTVLKMKTAVASVSSTEVTNDILEPEAPFHETNIGLFPQITPKVKRSQPSVGMQEPQQKHIEDISKHNKKIKAKNIITSPKHTEIFNIRVKRNEHNHGENEGKDISTKIKYDTSLRKRNTKPSWDILDVMKHVRYSFLGKIFENTLQNQIKADQEDLVDITKLGKEKLDPGLLPMVKSTLSTLLESPETNFLMVIFGGHLRALTDKHSPIVQSIKHVIENTDSENTLIIVTGSCAEDKASGDLKSENKNKELFAHRPLPVYAKGPESYILSECSLLYDIPLTVRKILELHSDKTGLPLAEPPTT